MKVFISHQRLDGPRAEEIADRLRVRHHIDSYLDVIDPQLDRNGRDLGEYIRSQMGKCTQLLAVVSFTTRESQWVPWEIGVATEKKYPLATFADYQSKVPEFLASWPYLRNMTEVDSYASASKRAQSSFIAKRAVHLDEATARVQSTDDFFSILRRDLGQ